MKIKGKRDAFFPSARENFHTTPEKLEQRIAPTILIVLGHTDLVAPVFL